MKAYEQKCLGYSRAKTDAWYRVTFENGERWEVPVQAIVDDRDEHYSDEHEDTVAFVRDGSLDPFNIEDWAQNNMNWSDVKDYARKVADSDECDYQEGWINGDKEIIGSV